MAAKRGKSQARRGGGGNSDGIPGWAWLVLGVALTVAVFFFAPQYLGKGSADGFFKPTPNPDARPPAMDAQSEDDAPIVEDGARPERPAGTDAATPKEQDYDFYSVLSGEETPLTDAELDRRARAEAEAERTERQRQEREQQALAERIRREREARETPPPAIDGPGDGPASDTGTASGTASGRNPDAADPAPATRPATTPERTASASEPLDARYLLQAGAFEASGDAEALKAKIAFLGLSARVESAQIQGKTVYRVRMGPYGTASELAEAKRKLAAGGLPAMAIKAR